MIYEILIASSGHVRWVRTSDEFSLEKLGARPVDFSDPPVALDLIRRDYDNHCIPWFGRSIDGHIFGFVLVKFHGKLDVGYYITTCRLSDF